MIIFINNTTVINPKPNYYTGVTWDNIVCDPLRSEHNFYILNH